MGILKNKNFIVVNDDGNIILTEEGSKLAKKIYERHQILTEALVMLGVDEDTAAEDACRIEHVISDESFEALKKSLSKNKKTKK